jgi:hypothetical protein
MIDPKNQSWWLTLNRPILGFEDEGEGAGAGDEGTEGEPGEGQEAEGEPDDKSGKVDDTAGLKSALEKERADRKKLEKELKIFRTAKQAADDAEKDDVDRLTAERDRAAEKAVKLAAGFKTSAVEAAVIAAAGKAKFRDPSDALRPEVLSIIGVEQDDDDPTKVTIDAASLDQAIKDLAKNKPHYIGIEEKKLPKSGSTYGGKPSDGKGDANAELKRKYPVLRNLK